MWWGTGAVVDGGREMGWVGGRWRGGGGRGEGVLRGTLGGNVWWLRAGGPRENRGS